MPEQVTKSIIVKGKVSDIYDIWADFEKFPNFMEPVKRIEKTGDRTSHWVVEGPFDSVIEWDAETTTLEQNKRIAWNSKNGDIKTSGQVTFTELPQNQTQVNVTLQYLPKGISSVIYDKLFGNLEEQLAENLRKFKAFAEEQA
ncbi:SRPBCC family protein [candidate division KSB1 bacterium]|nr:SRPBCC family protein [candidate division KSB1 bacterium]NIR68507.1 SRPBCC family protein [candidate division KSB1 bacterium]NIS22521.1 SRPBCC family protein [candidate division KSB1 bacterium]NIT69365.1 SRPBCC family protein [candidate division KSB1 bacterium]NIU23026.1 SRPBCC family protein [candidate division KSB1 bacterium]